jgi:hypothetical protein
VRIVCVGCACLSSVFVCELTACTSPAPCVLTALLFQMRPRTWAMAAAVAVVLLCSSSAAVRAVPTDPAAQAAACPHTSLWPWPQSLGPCGTSLLSVDPTSFQFQVVTAAGADAATMALLNRALARAQNVLFPADLPVMPFRSSIYENRMPNPPAPLPAATPLTGPFLIAVADLSSPAAIELAYGVDESYSLSINVGTPSQITAATVTQRTPAHSTPHRTAPHGTQHCLSLTPSVCVAIIDRRFPALRADRCGVLCARWRLCRKCCSGRLSTVPLGSVTI